MKIRWCASSSGGCSRGGIFNIVRAATHDVRPGCTGLRPVLRDEHVVLEWPTLTL